jgi:hypothetical protein
MPMCPRCSGTGLAQDVAPQCLDTVLGVTTAAIAVNTLATVLDHDAIDTGT